MTIYKVRMAIIQTVRRRREMMTETVEDKEEIVIDNLETARRIFDEYRNNVKFSCQHAGRTGLAELFVPHVHANGKLAYWPDNEEYIERWVKQ